QLDGHLRVLDHDRVVTVSRVSGFGFFASASGAIVCVRLMMSLKNASLALWVITVNPSATAARMPPEWSKWWWLLATYFSGLSGRSSRAFAMTASVRVSFCGASMSI